MSSEAPTPPADASTEHAGAAPKDIGSGLGVKLSPSRAAMLALAIIAAALSFVLSGAIPEAWMRDWESLDRWFDSDAPWVFRNMTDLGSVQRTHKHVLFPLLTYPPVKLLGMFGVGDHLAVRMITALFAGIWTATLFAILKLTRGSLADAVTFTVLALASSSFIFWTAVPETFMLGSLSILLALLLVAAKASLRRPALASLLVSILTLGTTLTNWMAGIVATFCVNPWRRSVLICGAALTIVTAISFVEAQLLRTRGNVWNLGRERQYVTLDLQQIAERSRAFLFHSMLMPEIHTEDHVHPFGNRYRPALSVQHSSIGSASAVELAGAGIWILLLVLGVWGLTADRKFDAFRFSLVAVLLGQLGLHCVFGLETFLYAFHFAALLVLVASWSTATRYRPAAIVATWLVIGVAFYSNGVAFLTACRTLPTL